jgi:endo-1,4-beta-xylanase
VVTLGGRKVGGLRLRGPRWRRLKLRESLPAGDQAVQLTLHGGTAGCQRAMVNDLRRVAVPAFASGTPLGPKRKIPLGAALDWSVALGKDHPLESTFLKDFDGLTPENAMKMDNVEPRRGEFDFSKADALLRFASAHGKSVHGHVLVWHAQLPGWLTGWPYTAQEAEQIMREWIFAIVGRYRGHVSEWDVVNEPFDEGGQWRHSVWFDALGPRFVEVALRLAHEADPAAKLYINEYDADLRGPKQEALAGLVADLRSRGVPLDGVGFQTHWSLEVAPPAEDALLAVFQRFAKLGVELQVTEMDVGIDTRADPLGRQAEEYSEAARVCQSVAACKRFTAWGVSDRDSWRGPRAKALLFDDQFGEKPAYRAVVDALNAG